MYSLAELRARDYEPEEDHFVHLREATWGDYLRILRARGDHSSPRIAYLDGTVEIMSPAENHEMIKSLLGCLIEAYCLDRGIPFDVVGSWTLKRKKEEAGAEPDECYRIGPTIRRGAWPDLAIEVVWTHGGINKLEIYRRLGVREVWYFEKGRLTHWALRNDKYVRVRRSQVLPDLDVELMLQFIDRPNTYEAIRDYRAALAATQR